MMQANHITTRRYPPSLSLIVLLLAVASMALSALVSRTVFERLPHLEDEVAYLFQARTYARGHLVVATPEPRRAFWQPFVVDYAPSGSRFSKYSPGWSAVLALGVLLGQPWVVNALFAPLTIVLTYRLGREIFNPDVGVIAAALTTFSPMALLLNGTLMGHTAALFGATLFFYAYWRIERSGGLAWGIAAGAALGIVLINRPLTAVGIAAPFIAWSVIRLGRDFVNRQSIGRIVRPLAALAAVTLLISTSIPIYNFAATGSATKNLYTLVWPYDRVGFGAANEYGRSGHTLEKGFRHVRFDLSLMAADLYGWQIGNLTTDLRDPESLRPELRDQLLNEGDYWPLTGLSWLLLPLGLLIGLQRRQMAFIAWIVISFVLLTQSVALPQNLLQDSRFAWAWVIALLAWLCVPLLFVVTSKKNDPTRWTWLLMAAALGLIVVHFTYWIGSQRYSTRYYFEGLTALSLISALPLAWLIRRSGQRWLVYGLLATVMLYTLYAYSTPRILALYRFNFIGQDKIDAVEARREGERDLLVIISGSDLRWRSAGALMAVTSPFLDSEIVVALDNQQPGVRDAILARFPDRQIIEMEGSGNDAWFKEN